MIIVFPVIIIVVVAGLEGIRDIMYSCHVYILLRFAREIKPEFGLVHEDFQSSLLFLPILLLLVAANVFALDIANPFASSRRSSGAG